MEVEIPNPLITDDSDDSSVNLKSWSSVTESVHSFLAIWPTLLGFILSRLLFGHLPQHSTQRFLLEFILIGFPSVILITVGSDYSVMYSLVVTIVTLAYLYANGEGDPSPKPKYEVGKRPIVFTLMRATAYSGTCAAILAVDFPSYPTEYRKSRTFGASAMDMGIGLFVVTMGLVSNRAKDFGDLRKLPRSVVPLLVLGLARTIVITAIHYHQDEAEYGKHLNAFFILGFTKLMGSCYSLLAKSDGQLLTLALGLLFLHELVLQLGLSQFVMSGAPRNGFLRANREGLSSLHGCVALYLLSIYLSKWYTALDYLSYKQLTTKLKKLLVAAVLCWLLAFSSAFLTGISRVTFSFGYVSWMFAVCLSLILIYAFFFELKQVGNPRPIGDGDKLTSQSLPTFVESLNMNGLTHFMLSNFLTGLVNLALKPENRDDIESVVILSVYMFVCAGVVFVMLKKRIRLA
ncbi:uncharacterized protein PIG-Wa [Drosophila kikkawai]|uniref:Phosphatidylinositol-glycan biosynthesis class W protein n=1 Tax=Drosophila kikkawai TaxID=30033 RepID=A0ABM4GEZ6_DROKI|nr:uncharacterized protein At4g17910 [Drosophila kikkawai]